MTFFVRAAACTLVLALLGATPASPPPSTLGQLVNETLKGSNIPGAQVVVVDRGKIVLNQAYGVRDMETQVPVDTHTRFEIGSITKQFTAAAILQLKEQGKLALSDPLGKYVPEYPHGKNITIEQLLWQVSGVPNYTEVPHFEKIAEGQPGDFSAALDLIKDKPLDFTPGTKWAYSNTNYLLLGRVVAVASGMPWETYVRTHIFDPANMTESAFATDEPHISDMATGYSVQKGTVVRAPILGGWAYSAGAIVSTAGDLAKWDAALFGGKIVSPADLALATTPGRLNDGKATGYGFGWVIDSYDKESRIWHNGGTFGFGATNNTFPTLEQRIIVVENNADAIPDGVVRMELLALNPQLAAYEKQGAPGEDPAITTQAKAVWAQFQSGSLQKNEFTSKMNATLTPDLVASAKAQFAPLGPGTSWVYRGKKSSGADTTYVWHVTFNNGLALNVYMALTKDGKIDSYLAGPN